MIKTLKHIIYKLIGSRNDRILKQYKSIVNEINKLESSIAQLTEIELANKTNIFRKRALSETLNAILPEAFAVCREASKRILGMRHFDVQLIGAIALHDGKIAEMKTGEGKTLASTLAIYLNSLIGGVHVITVNEYLAKRDAILLAPLYEFLGLTVGVNISNMSLHEKQDAYQKNILYGTSNEFGFDYLRNNMVFDKSQKLKNNFLYAIVDEIDSVLIDEARTPLIISGAADGAEGISIQIDKIPSQLQRQETEDGEGDFWIDEKNNNVILSETGHIKSEKLLIEMNLLQPDDSLYNANNIHIVHYILATLRAYFLYKNNQQYVIQNNEIVIVDEFTGRLMAGRRWGDGIHQAIEAKEKLPINPENHTLATITVQNYFRIYKKLSGMTGTADTEASEFQQIYKLEVLIVPTNTKMIRVDYNDQIYLNNSDKYNAIILAVQEAQKKEQPVLIGTTSVESSEIISAALKAAHLKHSVLNAKNHTEEAEIIAQAGNLSSITIATNMAGRGTDIVLGGNYQQEISHLKKLENCKETDIVLIKEAWKKRHDAVVAAGGLYIIGTERHESRRVDNQLRGRAGRQGDPGSSRFFLSLEDSLLRIFGGERVSSLMKRLGLDKGESIEHKLLSKSIASAQQKVEWHNFDMRKQLLEYDDIANDQRRVIYEERDHVIENQNPKSVIENIITTTIKQLINVNDDMTDDEKSTHIQSVCEKLRIPHTEVSEISAITSYIVNLYHDKLDKFRLSIQSTIGKLINNDISDAENIEALKRFTRQVGVELESKENLSVAIQEVIEIIFKHQSSGFQRTVLLQHIDFYWREHLTKLEYLRQGIGLRGYAQKNPKQEYKREAFEIFSNMLDTMKLDVTRTILSANLVFVCKPEENNNSIKEIKDDNIIKSVIDNKNKELTKANGSFNRKKYKFK